MKKLETSEIGSNGDILLKECKPVIGYEGLYEIDSNGKIFSVERYYVNSIGRSHKVKRSERKPVKHETGYLVIGLRKDGKTRTFRHHRVVASNLIDNPKNLPFVNHKDGNKTNNDPQNLEWVSEKENTNHAIKFGLFNVDGEANYSAKLSEEDVINALGRVLSGEEINDVSLSLNVNRNTLPKRFSKCSRSKEWDEYKKTLKSKAAKKRWNRDI